ncbi:MAG: dUTP diphosphatase [Spirochaetaceae bacterium]|nr:dUTP diphosphatase [Spirochaetaceae bacterium]
MQSIQVQIRKLNARAQLPVYETAGAAGMDVYALLDDPVMLTPGARVLIPTGLALEIPSGYEAQIRPRSGRALKSGLTVLNAPGTIDSDYRGELAIILINLGEKTEIINDGDRIAQMVFSPVLQAVLEVTETLSQTERGYEGFGSTGK